MNTQLRNKPEINKHSLTFGKWLWCVDLVEFFILFVHKVELCYIIVISMENNSIAFSRPRPLQRMQMLSKAAASGTSKVSWLCSLVAKLQKSQWCKRMIIGSLCISVVPVDMVVVFAYLLPCTTGVCKLSMSCILLYLWNVRRWRSTSTLTTRWDRRESATKA